VSQVAPLGTLTLRPVGRAGDGSDLTKWSTVLQYEVCNLPAGEQAWIANFGGPYQDHWRILRATDGEQTDWSGDYQSAEDALRQLESTLRQRL
jgi:hypothetical protein